MQCRDLLMYCRQCSMQGEHRCRLFSYSVMIFCVQPRTTVSSGFQLAFPRFVHQLWLNGSKLEPAECAGKQPSERTIARVKGSYHLKPTMCTMEGWTLDGHRSVCVSFQLSHSMEQHLIIEAIEHKAVFSVHGPPAPLSDTARLSRLQTREI